MAEDVNKEIAVEENSDAVTPPDEVTETASEEVVETDASASEAEVPAPKESTAETTPEGEGESAENKKEEAAGEAEASAGPKTPREAAEAGGPVNTKRAAATVALQEGRLEVTAPRKRRKFIRPRNGNLDYYDNVKDKYAEEENRRAGGTASFSFTEVVSQASVGQQRKENLTVKPLTVKVIAAYDDPELGTCALCEYVSPDAPDDDPVIIYVPIDKFTEYTYQELKERHFANSKVFVKKRLNSTTDVIIEGFKRDRGDIVFIGNRNLAMKYNRTFWFEEVIDRVSQGYRYQEGVNMQARVASVSNWGLFVELQGIESYIPTHELSFVPNDNNTDEYANGDIVWVKIKKIERDERRRTVDVTLSVKDTKKNPVEQAAKHIHKGMIRSGTVKYKNPRVQNPYIFVDLGRDVRCHCPLTMPCSVGDNVVIRMDDPTRDKETGEVKLSGLLEHVDHVRR